jgi:hypothetical protein
VTLNKVYFDQIKELPLGIAYENILPTPDRRYIYGGVAWPGKRPGFAVVVLMDSEKHFDGHDVCLIAEHETFSIRELVRQIAVLDDIYMPDRWIGDNRNNAADKFIKEVDADGDRDRRRSKLMFVYTPMLDMDNFYQYALDEIKRLLDKDRRMLFLKESIISNYLSDIENDAITDLKHGDYPAIEALTYAVITIMNNKIREDTERKRPVVQDRSYRLGVYNNYRRMRYRTG